MFKLRGMLHAQFGIHCLQYEVMPRKLSIYFLAEGLGRVCIAKVCLAVRDFCLAVLTGPGYVTSLEQNCNLERLSL